MNEGSGHTELKWTERKGRKRIYYYYPHNIMSDDGDVAGHGGIE